MGEDTAELKRPWNFGEACNMNEQQGQQQPWNQPEPVEIVQQALWSRGVEPARACEVVCAVQVLWS